MTMFFLGDGDLANQQGPIPGTVPAQPSMSPPSFSGFAQSGTPFAQVPAYLPTLTLPVGRNVGLQERDRPLTVTGIAANATSINNLTFDVPCTVFAITASVVDTAGADLPVGLDPLDCFRVQMQRTTGDRFQTNPCLGSTVCGTGRQPRLIGPNGWMFDVGSTLQVLVTPLRADLSIDITFWTCEVRGPFNFAWKAIPYGYVG